jgi:hypothetical protein
MLDEKVGKIKNIKYESELDTLEITIVITDNKFKKKLLRDLALSGSIKFEGNEILYTGNIAE